MRWPIVGGALALIVVAVALYAVRHRVMTVLPDPVAPKRDIARIRTEQTARLTKSLADIGVAFGTPLYLRIFKEEGAFEVFVKHNDTYRLFRRYPICTFSGALGPKLKEGDHQSPEGFYTVDLAALNPNSRFHLSFNLGFPNAYDRGHDRTGSFLMVHGGCVSVGCYAMTDPMIEEIYVLVEAALRAGQPSVPVHAFPFRMTDARMALAGADSWFSFWSELRAAYTIFETTRLPAVITVNDGHYRATPPMTN